MLPYIMCSVEGQLLFLIGYTLLKSPFHPHLIHIKILRLRSRQIFQISQLHRPHFFLPLLEDGSFPSHFDCCRTYVLTNILLPLLRNGTATR